MTWSSFSGGFPTEELRISLSETGFPSESLCLLLAGLCWADEGLGGSWILGIMDFGRFLGRCAGLLPGLVFVEQSDGTEPESYETKKHEWECIYWQISTACYEKINQRIMSSDRNGLKKVTTTQWFKFSKNWPTFFSTTTIKIKEAEQFITFSRARTWGRKWALDWRWG